MTRIASKNTIANMLYGDMIGLVFRPFMIVLSNSTADFFLASALH